MVGRVTTGPVRRRWTAARIATDGNDVWPPGRPPPRPSSPETGCHHVRYTPRLYQERIRLRPRRRRTVKATQSPRLRYSAPTGPSTSTTVSSARGMCLCNVHNGLFLSGRKCHRATNSCDISRPRTRASCGRITGGLRTPATSGRPSVGISTKRVHRVPGSQDVRRVVRRSSSITSRPTIDNNNNIIIMDKLTYNNNNITLLRIIFDLIGEEWTQIIIIQYNIVLVKEATQQQRE